MMLTMSTTLKKYFHFANCCHGYVDINAGKEKIGFILKHDFSTTNHDKRSRQLVIWNSRHCLGSELESYYSNK